MNSIAQIIVAQSRTVTRNAERLLTGIRPDQFGRFAVTGGVVIKSNHPAFAFGHLALYPKKALALVGDSLPAAVNYPPQYDELFKAGVECRDDVNGTLYPKMEEIAKHFFDATNAAMESIATISDEVLLRENPAEQRLRDRFATIAAMMTFYLGGHAQLHLGQVSAWRRAMGLGPAA